MPILYAELQVAGRQVACEVASFSFEQPTDAQGRPSSIVRVGLLQVLISGEAAGWPLWEEIKFNSYRRESGHLVFFQNEGITAKRYTFYDAALVFCECRYDGRGKGGKQPALVVELHFSAATIELDGIRLEAHSLIPWPTDKDTSFRALTKPADPQPSTHLAAGVGLAATAKLKAEQVATGLVKKVINPAGAVATEIGGVSLAAVGRTAALLPGLLLQPVNSNADPAKDYDWQLYHRNSQRGIAIPAPPKLDAVRLAELEHALASGTLTASEETELILLLDKVKGIRIQRLADLKATTGVVPNSPKPTKPYKNKKQLLGNGPSKQKSKRTQYLGRTPGKSSATGREVVKRMELEGKIQADSVGGKQVLGPDGEWHALPKTDMGHLHDAVNWWNNEGRKHGAKSPEVREWMLDPANYELEPTSLNRSRGAKLKDRYLPPLK